MCKLRLGGPFKSHRLSQWTNNNPSFGHIVCQPIRRLQVGPDLPNRSHVSVKSLKMKDEEWKINDTCYLA